MKKGLLILFAILHMQFVFSQAVGDKIQLTGFDKAVITGIKTPNTTPTCGVFSYDPRIESRGADSYFLVDIYVVRFVEWTNTDMGYVPPDPPFFYENSLGGFAVNIQKNGHVWYCHRYSEAELKLTNEFINIGAPYICPVQINNPSPVSTANQSYGVAYGPNKAHNGMVTPVKKIVLQERVPYKIGTFEFKIKDASFTSGFVFNVSSLAYCFSVGDGTGATNPVVGYLDMDPDIPLKPQAVETAPETPQLADGLKNQFCQNEQGRFTIKGTTLPTRATSCEWSVSSTPKGPKLTDSNLFSLSQDMGEAKGCNITWLKADTYYVNVFSKNAIENSKDTVSMQVTVKAVPVVKILVDGASHTTDKIKKCAGTQVLLATNTGLTYKWEGTQNSVTGSSTTETLVIDGTNPVDKKYKVTGMASGCSASDSVVFTVNPLPDVQLRPANGAYPSGQTLLAEVITNSGSSADFTYNWAAPEVKPNGGSELNFIVKETDPTNIAVTVVNSSTLCPKELTATITDNGNGLKVNLTPMSAGICNRGVGRLKALISGGNGLYTCSWYLGRDLTAIPLVEHAGILSEDYYTVNSTQGLTYTLKVSDGRLVTTREITLLEDKSHTAIAVQTVPVIRVAKNSQVVLVADPTTPDVGTNSYTWEPVDKLAATGEKDKQYPLTASLIADQDYKVVMANVQGGVTCFSEGMTKVQLYTIGEADPLLVSVDPSDITLCKNSQLNFITTVSGAGSGTPVCVWRPTVGLNNPNIANPVLDASKVGKTGLVEYTLTVTRNGQTTTRRISVNIANFTAPMLAFANEPHCADSLLKLSVSGGAVSKYNWTIEQAGVTSTTSTTVSQLQIADAGSYNISVMGETANCKTGRIGPKEVELRKISVEMKVVPQSYRSGESIIATVTPSNGWGDNNNAAYYYTWNKPKAATEERAKNIYSVPGAWEGKYDFEVKVRDANNCEAVVTGDATIQAGGLTLDLAQVNIFCNGGSAMMTATAKGGGGGYTYTWKSGATTVRTNSTALNIADSYFAETPSETYEVTVSDQTLPTPLTVTKTITLTKNGANAPVLNAGGPQIAVAAVNDVAILAAELTTLTTAPYSWQWSGKFSTDADAKKQITQTAPVTGNTIYKVYAVDANGCISKPSEVEVFVKATDKFDILINATTTMCANASQQLSTTLVPAEVAATYHWTPSSGVTIDDANAAMPVITAAKAGTYQVSVAVTVNGVKRTASKSITVTSDKLPVLALTYNTLCEGDTVTVKNTATGVTIREYQWYVNDLYVASGSQLPLSVNGNNVKIKVVATSTQSCVASKEDTKTLFAQPTIAWDAASDIQDATTEIELGVTTTAKVVAQSAAPAFTYIWVKPTSRNGNTYTVTPGLSDSGYDFDVYATDGNGCKTKHKIQRVTVAKENLEITPELRYAACIGGSAVLVISDKNINGATGPFTYEWTKESSNTILGTDSVFIAQNITAVTKYHVVVTKKEGGKTKIGEKDITVTLNAGTVPSIKACEDVTIVTGNKAVLYATTTATAAVNWNWGPIGDKLSAAEARLQNPQTEILNADKKFGVYATNAQQCVSNVDSVNVHVVADGVDVLKVEIVPDIQLCLGNETKFTAKVSGGSGAVVSCNWLPADMKVIAGHPLMATYTVKNAGKDTITVVVKKGMQTVTARKEITILDQQAPKLAFDNLATVKCTGNMLTVNSGGLPVSGGYTWTINGRTDLGNTSNQYEFTAANSYNVKVVARGNGGCMADTLEKDLTITATPSLVVQEEENCGKAKLVAVASDATNYTWSVVTPTLAGGETLAGCDSVYIVRTNLMSEPYAYKVVASNANCRSEEKTVSRTVYGLPDTIILNPYRKTLYPNEQAEINASFTPDLNYTLNWTNTGDNIESQNGKAMKTKALTNPSNEFTLTVTNTVSAACQISNTSVITISSDDFRIYFDLDTMDVCSGVERNFVARNMNCKDMPINYVFTCADYPGFVPVNQNGVNVEQATIKYSFIQEGLYKLYATGTDAGGTVRKDSLVVRVNPIPTIKFTSPSAGIPQSLCLNKGEIKVNIEATKGVAGWQLKYKLGTAKKVEAFTEAKHQLVLTTGGAFLADTIVNSKGCSAPVSPKYGFEVKDDIPKFKLNATELTKCQGGQTDLKLVISDTSSVDYPLTLHYWLDVSMQTATIDATHKFMPTAPGSYTIDSIVSARQCVFRLADNNTVEVKEYLETTPSLVVNKTLREFCENSSVDVPVTITGGKPEYIVTYTLNGVQMTANFSASGNISVVDNGPLVLKDFKDGNGCGIFTLDDTVKIRKHENPAMAITSISTQMCGGQLDLGLSLTKGVAPYTITYTVGGGAPQTKEISSVGADKSAVWNITTEGAYVVTKVQDQHCEIPGTDVTGSGPGFIVTPLRLYAKLKNNADICASDAAKIELDFTGTQWADVVGKVRVTYKFIPAGSSTPETKSADFVVNPTNPVITPVPQGTYELTAVSDLGAVGCQGILSTVDSENKITVIDAPVVEIDSMDFALNKGKSFVLGVKNPNELKFEYAWQIDGASFNKVVAPFSISGTMADSDVRYILKGTNLTSSSCYNTDTVTAYRIPGAPKVTIDTNLTRNDLVIKFNPASVSDKIDGYSIMHNLWDGYGIESEYSPKAFCEGTNSWAIAQNNLDTLEFFYVRAGRTIKMNGVNKSYYSTSSDTVGYYKFNIEVNTETGSENLMAVFFDMAKIGYSKSEDILRKLSPAVPYVYKFDFESQEWQYTYVRPNGQPLGSFEVHPETLMKFKPESATSFLQYGKLPAKMSIELENTNTELFNENNSFMLPHRVDLKDVVAIFQELKNVRYIYYWDFVNQEWIAAQKRPNGSVQGNFKVKALMPLKFLIQENESNVIWK